MSCCRIRREQKRSTLNSISLTVNLQNRNSSTVSHIEKKYSTQLLSDYILNISDKDEKSIENDYNLINNKLTGSSWFSTKIIINQCIKTFETPLDKLPFQSGTFFVEQLNKLKVPQRYNDIIKQTVEDQIEIIGEIEDKESFQNLSNKFYCNLNDEYGAISHIGLIIYGFIPIENNSNSNNSLKLICCGHCEELEPSNVKRLPISMSSNKYIKNYIIYQLLNRVSNIVRDMIEIRDINSEEIKLPIELNTNSFYKGMNSENIVKIMGLKSYPIYRVDSEGYLESDYGLFINKKYVLIGELGRGAYSKVFESINVFTKTRCAIKIIRNIEPFISASKSEFEILKDVQNNNLCIHLQQHFVWKKHCCLVFPMYGPSILDIMSQNKYKPFPNYIVRSLTFQICKAIQFIHSIGIVFTDLKPENIILISGDVFTINIDNTNNKSQMLIPYNSKIKIIDFGSAVYEIPKGNRKKFNNHLIQTRHYRAPEVVLGLSWNRSVDIWSIGTLILELINGYMVFVTHCPIDHINQMQKMIGPIPTELIRCSSKEKFEILFHEKDYTLKINNAKKSQIQCKLLNHYFDLNKLEELNLFYFVSRCLRWKPNERIKSNQFDTHKYFKFIKNKISHKHNNINNNINNNDTNIILTQQTTNK